MKTNRPPAVIRILTELERDALGRELFHLIRAQVARDHRALGEPAVAPSCSCVAQGCRFICHLDAARSLWERRRQLQDEQGPGHDARGHAAARDLSPNPPPVRR